MPPVEADAVPSGATPEQLLAIQQGIMVPGLPGEKFLKRKRFGL